MNTTTSRRGDARNLCAEQNRNDDPRKMDLSELYYEQLLLSVGRISMVHTPVVTLAWQLLTCQSFYSSARRFLDKKI